MAKGDQINIKPHFKNEGQALPCEAEIGDLYVFSHFDESDPEATATLWFCIKGSGGHNGNAIWARIHIDGTWPCAVTPPIPPNYPELPKKG